MALCARPGRLSENTEGLDPGLGQRLKAAQAASWERFGRAVDFFLPGMFMLNGQTGLYPAVSLTGSACQLNCAHCAGRLLAPMIPATSPEALKQTAADLMHRGRFGLLVSGGSDSEGRLPWPRYYDALAWIRDHTDLTVTVHAGYLGEDVARRLKACGAVQALVDVMGDDDTAREIYRLQRGAAPVWETLDALAAAGLEAAPHVVVGLNRGRIVGEYRALDRLAAYRPTRLIAVAFHPLAGTDLAGASPPAVEAVADFLAAARLALPETLVQLGCARPKGAYGRRLEGLALAAGVNALAFPTDAADRRAEDLGLAVRRFPTCCSLAGSPRLKAAPTF
jgi:hypothetical protein